MIGCLTETTTCVVAKLLVQIIGVILVSNISLSFFQKRNWSLRIDLSDHNLDEGDKEASAISEEKEDDPILLIWSWIYVI